ncbi:MAG: 50S ribosomal protein L20 [Deltaproteobacteria bacterium]|nr:50S ribosomal protein L20 [Deltaproteobacteria bacterium]
MPRVKRGFKARRRRNKVLKLAKGGRGGRSKLFRTAVEAVKKNLSYAYVGRRLKKRDYRSLWINRIGAALDGYGVSYSAFMGLLSKAGIILNRKILADLAVSDPKGFESVVKQVRA